MRTLIGHISFSLKEFFSSFISYKIHHERTDLRLSANVSDPTGIKFQNNTLLIGTNTAASQPEQPIDLSLMYKEINQCHSVIDRIDKILQFVQNDNEKAFQKYDGTVIEKRERTFK